ncbi:MAG TPA: multicopper oxidase family protein [Longimicrobiaceae bacterium]|nr:multicopper oxidase family protein [Longimicrobiaceae bacterium]
MRIARGLTLIACTTIGMAATAPLLAAQIDTTAASGHDMMDHSMMGHDMGAMGDGDGAQWRMPPMDPSMIMPASMMQVTPDVSPFLPGMGVDPATIPEAVFRKVVEMQDGDTLNLESGLVRRTIKDRTFVMYGFNGQYPGPLIRAPQNATIIVNFKNSTELPTTMHWHGVRLDNEFDGVPNVTQDLVPPGGTFRYEVFFRDAGIYWYHPHHREDITQDMGLYGNMLIRSPDPDYYSPVNREQILMLDDLLIDQQGLFPYGKESPSHALMGRFGNVLLVNGEPEYNLEVQRGEVVRFFFTDVSNTRVFNLSFDGAPIKVVGSDVGKFEREVMVQSVVISPAERYTVEVLFEEPGTYALTNRVQAVDHYNGVFVARVDTLGFVTVSEERTDESHRAAFELLRENEDVIAEIDPYRQYFDGPVDHELEIGVDLGALPVPVLRMIAADTSYFAPVEWNGTMPMMNYASTGNTVTWILRDAATGQENMAIDWTFELGEVSKIRINNSADSSHPMQHPIHFHGQRFLVLSRNGVPNNNLVWKDTAVVPVGSTVDILLEASNPGDWMAHCHIAEHLGAGMKMIFHVVP